MSVRTRKPRPAETFFKVREEFKGLSLLEIRPVTGRTHQIRVHLASAGHPLAGDSRYGRRKEEPKFPHLFLHAHRLSFIHPGTGERVEFVSELPQGLARILEKLRMPGSR
jgi:23S rRNA pseudouridine1911/1915/1917 synthase